MSTDLIRGDNRGELVRRGVELHAAGASWHEAAKTVGLSYEQLRCGADPKFAQSRRDSINARRRARWADTYIPPAEHRVDRALSPKEASAAILSVPLDTRSRLAKFMGDPLPGRSALDFRNRVRADVRGQASTSDSPTITTSHIYQPDAG